jgi:TPR repeat protein
MKGGASPAGTERILRQNLVAKQNIVTFDIADLRRKADAGSAVAQTVLGICFLEGTDAEVNYQEAFRLLSAAAKQGTSRSVVNLARMYEEGLGVEKNMAEAIRLYKAVAKVEFFAQIALGRIYSRGKSVVADRAEALRFYSLATDWGDRVVDCDEMREAREFVARYPK